MRWRIAATIAGIVLLSVVGTGIAVHALLVADRVSAERSLAHQQIRAAVKIYDRTGLLSFDARLDDASAPASLREAVTTDGAWAVLVDGGATRTVWAAQRTHGHVLTTHRRFAVEDGQLRSVDQALVVAGAVAFVVAVLLGLVSAQRLGRRLRRASRAAREVTSGDDPQSLRRAVGERRDEVGDLADAVDAMAERLRERLRGEQQFTADVAHDLRTPVTGLVTAAALLEDSRPAEMVRERAAALVRLVEDLLEVARLDRGAEEARLEDVDLARLVSRTVRRGVESGELVDGEVTTDLEDGVHALTDGRRLERVLSNLLRNAVQHGGAPVAVSQHGRVLVVRDHGPGFDAETLAEGPQRFRSRGAGHGLGLVIAVGQARVLGARLELANAPDGGARVSLTIPAPDDPAATSQNRDQVGVRP